MITYEVTGPHASGDYMVVYRTPGASNVLTVVATASSKHGAELECDRMNAESRQTEAAIKADMAARGVLSLDKEN